MPHWELIYRIAIWLAQCAGSYFACLLVWTILKGKRPEHAKRWMKWLASWKRFKEGGYLRLNETFAVVAFASLVLVTLGFQTRHLALTPIEEYHNVKILKQIDDSDWLLEREDGKFRFRCCPDFDCKPFVGVGFIAWKVRYAQMAGCESIKDRELGFFYDQPPREIFPGSGEKRKEWGD